MNEDFITNLNGSKIKKLANDEKEKCVCIDFYRSMFDRIDKGR